MCPGGVGSASAPRESDVHPVVQVAGRYRQLVGAAAQQLCRFGGPHRWSARCAPDELADALVGEHEPVGASEHQEPPHEFRSIADLSQHLLDEDGRAVPHVLQHLDPGVSQDFGGVAQNLRARAVGPGDVDGAPNTARSIASDSSERQSRMNLLIVY